MATSRAFTLNATGEPLVPGETIPGTTQYGLIAVQNLNSYVDFVGSGLTWYNGPDEDANPAFNFANEGYVICITGNTTAPVGANGVVTNQYGNPVGIKFYRSVDKTEASFIALASAVTGKAYNTGNAAAADLALSGIASTWITESSITYTQISWYRDRYLNQPNNCPTMAEGQNLYLGSDDKIYWNQNGSLFSTELDEGLVDQDGLIGDVTGQSTGTVYTVSYGVLSATGKSCGIL
jgi:hypothetical protein